MTDRVLDWRPNPDPASAGFRFAALSCFASGTAHATARRVKRVWLDQGSEGACTGFAAEHARGTSPYPAAVTNTTAREVYDLARRLDEWPGEDYEGSSVNGAMKAERDLGRISEWHWCFTLPELEHALSYHGAVVAGTNWYEGMWEPDPDGYLRPTGPVVGGHSYALTGYEAQAGDPRRYFISNSWGRGWGLDGGAWILAEDLQRLLTEGGELACPKKVRRA